MATLFEPFEVRFPQDPIVEVNEPRPGLLKRIARWWGAMADRTCPRCGGVFRPLSPGARGGYSPKPLCQECDTLARAHPPQGGSGLVLPRPLPTSLPGPGRRTSY
jgi:hypothetical protein